MPLLLMLTSALFAPVPVRAVPVIQTSKPPATEKSALSAVTLTLQDLPTGFEELPLESKLWLASAIAEVNQLFAQQHIRFDNYFAFASSDVNSETILVFGSTGILPNHPLSRVWFDFTLHQLRQPRTQQQILKEVQRELPVQPDIKIEMLREVNKVANRALGISLAFKIENDFPSVRTDIAAFRRNRVVAFIAIYYLDGSKPVVTIKDVATKLDDRLMQSSATNNNR